VRVEATGRRGRHATSSMPELSEAPARDLVCMKIRHAADMMAADK